MVKRLHANLGPHGNRAPLPKGLSNMDENDDDQHFPSLRIRLMGDKTRRLQRPAMMILQGPTMQQISQALESDCQSLFAPSKPQTKEQTKEQTTLQRLPCCWTQGFVRHSMG